MTPHMIHYQVDLQSLTEIEHGLKMCKDRSPDVLRAAINETAKDLVKWLPRKAAEKYYLKQTEARKTIRRTSATRRELVAYVFSNGKPLELYGAKLSPKYKQPSIPGNPGHTGNVKRVNPAKWLYKRPSAGRDKYKAFVTTFKSGHKTLVQRIPGSHARKNPKKEAIKTMFTSSVPNMLGHIVGTGEGLYWQVNGEVNSMLLRHIESQMQRYLK